MDVIKDTGQEDKDSICHLEVLEPATDEEVRKLLMSAPTKSCSSDPIPTGLLKLCVEELLPVITRIVNLSMSTCTMPENLKEAIIIPLLKKASLDPEMFKNFRPVSNLPYISKLIERVVCVRYNNHFQKHNLHDPLQSAYRQKHSTETAVLKVQNDLLMAIDKQQCAFLVLLDLSAAFDTVDHQILLTRMSSRIGICGDAHKWFKSYLSDRKQHICVGNASSIDHILDCGVPQGSVFGPQAFGTYTLPIGDITRKHNVEYHFYADDTQLYIMFDPSIPGEDLKAKKKIEACIEDIKQWMAANHLKLNTDKTEVLFVGTPAQLKKVQVESIQVGESKIKPSVEVRNIGAYFASDMSLRKHVTKVCQASYYHLRNIQKIKRYLSKDTLHQLAHAFITSRLDFMNSLLYGIPQTLIQKLQRVQNSMARLVTGTKKREHITPVLQQLHWLPVKERISFKILLLTYKSLNNHAPEYLQGLLKPDIKQGLRSSKKQCLIPPKTKLSTYGDRSFEAAAPRLWNELPLSIRQSTSVNSFKKNLKTHLFKQVFSISK